jgi:RimJ/RimL family protein N-acetyltransferase
MNSSVFTSIVVNRNNIDRLIKTSPRLFDTWQENVNACFPDDDGTTKNKTALRNMIHANDDSVDYIMLCDGNTGVVVASCSILYRYKSSCEIHAVCVSAKHRGRNCCSVLMDRVKKHLRDNRPNIATINIFCYTSNFPACKCYTRAFGQPCKITRSGKTKFKFAMHRQ